MNEIDEEYTNNKSKWTADSAAVKSIAARLSTTPAEIVADLDGAKYLSGAEQVSGDWLGGGAAKSMKSTADFLKSVGRINAFADSYAKYVNAEFAKAAVAK